MYIASIKRSIKIGLKQTLCYMETKSGLYTIRKNNLLFLYSVFKALLFETHAYNDQTV